MLLEKLNIGSWLTIRDRKIILKLGIPLLIFNTFISPLQAQESSDPERASTNSPSLEEIIVTAARKSENLQQSALAISAFDANSLEMKGIKSVNDLFFASPSLNGAIYQGDLQLNIRGIGTTTVIGGADSTIAVHSDGVYLSRTFAGVSSYVDLERVEIVRGPQGTLYGRNATGGSINFITKSPSYDWTGDAKVTYGNYDTTNIFAAIGGPIIQDKLAFRLAVQTNNHDGYTKIIKPPQNVPGGLNQQGEDRAEDQQDIYTRLKLLWEPSDSVSLLVSGDYYKADDKAIVWHFLTDGYDSSPVFSAAQEAAGGRGPYYERKQYSAGITPRNEPEHWGLSAKLSVDLNGYTLTSHTAYRKTHSDFYNDSSNAFVFLIDQLRSEKHRQFSQEFQINSPADSKFEYVAGAYLFWEDNEIVNEYNIPTMMAEIGLPTAPDCCLAAINGEGESKAYALFGQGSYHLTDKLSVTLGGRYSWEERDGEQDVFITGLGFGNLSNLKADSWDAFTPKFGIEYQASENAFFYGSISRGFKSGVFNLASFQNDPVDPEFVWSYEVGAKLDLFDHRVRLNVAGFYYDYEDLQVQFVESNNVLTENAATATIYGIETELTALLSDNLQIELNGTWLDATFDDYSTVNPKTPQLGVLDLSGNPLAKSPEFKVNAGIEYRLTVGTLGKLILRTDLSWQDKVYFTQYKFDGAAEGEYWWAKARASFEPTESNLKVALFVDNIFDEEVAANINIAGDFDRSRGFGNLMPPRTYGIEAIYSF